VPRALLGILALALLLRVGVIAGTWDDQPFGDAADFNRHAISLTLVGTYAPTAFAEPFGASALRPPAYPYLLGAIYEVVGIKFNAARLVGALLGTLSVALVYLLALRLWGARHARWAAGLTAVFPPLVWLCAGLLSENLFVPLVLGAALALVEWRRDRRLRWALAAGALIGVATLTRTNGALLLLPAAVALLPARPVPWRSAAALAAAFALVLVPWTIRNAAVFGDFLPLGTQSGYTIAGQYNSQAAAPGDLRAAWRVPQDVPELRGLFGRPGLDEAEVDRELRARGLRFARENPDHVWSVLHLNTRRLFDAGPGHEFVSGLSYTEIGVAKAWRGGLGIWVNLMLLLAVAGLVVMARRRTLGPLFVWLVPVVLFAGVVWLLGPPRYRAPLDPFLLMLGAGAIVAFRERRGRRPPSRREPLGSSG
jgi:4-amino-4-deoxy-L-arabinose transferase-like glycosyltransferase